MEKQIERMEKYKIGGIWIHFPFVPYGPQEDFMQKLVESLDNAKNAMLESPTGTGKTMCLLCASLAWIDSKRKMQETLHMFPDGFGDVFEDGKIDTKNPSGAEWEDERKRYKIYFCTRTHSQIMQIVKEFQSCGYTHLRSSVLASRRHLCINPSAHPEDNTNNLDSKCRALRGARGCDAAGPDIEDLPKKCSSCAQDHKCPYYTNYEKMVQQGLDHPFTKSGAFDQKSLIEKCKDFKVCPFYVSRHLQKQADIVFLPYTYIFNPHILRGLQLNLKDSILIIDEGHNLEKVCEENASFNMKVSDLSNCREELNQTLKFFQDIAVDLPVDISEKDVLELDSILKVLHELISTRIVAGTAYPGKLCQDLFNEAGFNHDRLLYNMKQWTRYVSEKEGKNEFMRKICDIASTVFDNDDCNVLQESFVLYKEVLTPEEAMKNEPKIFFWCFEAGVIMRSLKKKGVHSFIVTSGTLSPLGPLKKSLSIPFDVELINKHVVNDSQILGVCLGSVQYAGQSVALNFTFNNRKRNGDSLYTALGHAVLDVAKATPKGLLIFFPSNTVKTECFDNWKNSFVTDGSGMTLADAINEEKPIYHEPSDTKELPKVQKQYARAIKDNGGACLCAVLSGKVSEGIDFKDDLGRAVIMVGLPYPNSYDVWVKHKKEHIRKKNGTMAEDDWYLAQAIRPVNQALGRIIRHQGDYGAVIFADVRYVITDPSNYKVVKSLPAWLERGLERIFSRMLESRLTQFFSGIPSKMVEIHRKSAEKQANTCDHHRDEMKKEICPCDRYHELIKLREAERVRQETLADEVTELGLKVKEMCIRNQELLREIEGKVSMERDKAERETVDSDCESNGESEWDYAVSQATD